MMPGYDFLQALAISITASLPQPAQEAELIFAGDAMQHSAQIEAAHTVNDTYDYSECFFSIKPYIENADYAVVNLETPLGGAPYTGYPCFSAPDSYAKSLIDCGFDLLLTANNHTLDRRDKGLIRTINTLDSLGISHIGTYVNDSIRNEEIPFIKDINGFKVGFLNYTYGTNGFIPGKDVVVNYIDTIKIKEDIISTRKAGAELIAVNIHWGDEYVLLPNKSQQHLAEFLAREGVEMIIGGHPHVVQPLKLTVQPNDSTKKQLTVFSLGNFISNMKTRDTRGGIVVKVKLRRDPSGRAYVDKAYYKPIFTIPAAPGRNFWVVDATTPIADPQWDYHRIQFMESATNLFERHNINVQLDMMPMSSCHPDL